MLNLATYTILSLSICKYPYATEGELKLRTILGEDYLIIPLNCCLGLSRFDSKNLCIATPSVTEVLSFSNRRPYKNCARRKQN